MKKSYISVLAIGMSLLGFISCDNFMDVHKEYVEDGETIYSPKVDSISFRAGEGRILFQCRLVNSPNVKTVVVYWNGGLNKHPITVPSSTSDTVFVEDFLPDMGEKIYSFDVRTIDAYGHQSLETTGSGASYGALFRSSLDQRRIDVGRMVEVGTVIEIRIPWAAAAGNLVRREIRYTAVGSVPTVIKVSPSESLTTITDAADGSSFEYRSLFLPEPTAVDTFSLDWESLTIDPAIFFNRATWAVSVSDYQNTEGSIAALIDGNLNSYWHSRYSNPDLADFPHWIIIDMTSVRDIRRLEIYRRNNMASIKTVQYFTGDDPAHDALTWAEIGRVEFPSTVLPRMLTLDIPSPDPVNKKRYLKIVVPDSYSAVAGIAEIYVYGSY
ncbi:chitobiase [Bacteroidia bacterium]|nr:chitobiase [Bacteroidia bacterium]